MVSVVAGCALVLGFVLAPGWAADVWRTVTVDDSGDVGEYSSLAILPSGQPAISYFDLRNQALKYAWRNGHGWDTITVDSSGHVGEHTSLAVLPSGFPVISYYDAGQRHLKYAWYAPATGWNSTVVDGAGGDCGAIGTSLGILPSGRPVISYRDHWNGWLKYAWQDGSSWFTTVVDDSANVGHHSSLGILPSGQPAISYLDYTNDRLKYAWSDGKSWQSTIAAEPGGVSTSLVILPSGHPAIVHDAAGGMNYVWFDGSQWQSTRVDSVSGWESWFGHPTLTLQPSGEPAICYVKRVFPFAPDLIYAWFDGASWHTQVVGLAGGGKSSLAFLPSGRPAISYRDLNSLMFAARMTIGDLNCDGGVDFDDIDPFVLALAGEPGYKAQYPNCNWLNADCNGDGTVNFDDIDPFVALLSKP